MKIVLLIVVIIGLIIIGGLTQEFKRHGFYRVIWRWFTGSNLNGHRFTNASWLRYGDKAHTDNGLAIHWHFLPRIHRAMYRTIGTIFAVLMVYGLVKDRSFTLKAMFIVGIILVVTGLFFSVQELRRWHTNKIMLTPLAMALAPMLSIPETTAEQSISIIPNALTAKSGEIGRIALPKAFAANPGQRENVEHLIKTRLPIPTEFVWHTATKKRQYLSIMASPRLPKMVKFFDMLKEIRNTAENEVLLGIESNGSLRTWNLSSDEPMMMVSANTRRGKTRLAMLIVCQVLNKGGRAIMIDPKRVGLDEFVAGHPKAIVYSEPREVEKSMWKPIIDFRNELNDRIDAFKLDRTVTFSRSLLVIDEISIWASISKQHWDQIRSGKDKATPPIFYDLSSVLWAGAQFNMNVLIFGQVLGHNVLGNAIESFGTKLLGGYTKQAYMRLIGITPIPTSQKARGRFLMHDGDDYPVWIQTILGEIDEMRDYALEPYQENKGVPRTEFSNGKIIKITKVNANND